MKTLVESHYTMFDFLPVNRNLDVASGDLDEKKCRAGPPILSPQGDIISIKKLCNNSPTSCFSNRKLNNLNQEQSLHEGSFSV